MNTVLSSFFPLGAPVTALPRRSDPRLLMAGSTPKARWQNSSLYPGYTTRGKIFRIAMRTLAASGLATSRRGNASASTRTATTFRELLDRFLPHATTASVLVGTDGPAQKLTVELRDHSGSIVGYAKYGERAAAVARLHAERNVLDGLPVNVGPRILAFDEWRSGVVLITAPLSGIPASTNLPVDASIHVYLRQLEVGRQFDLEKHPFVTDALNRLPTIERYLPALATRRWSVAIQHGDFAPWNVRRSAERVSAFDWEYGTLAGFPGLDIAYFWLQTLALINGAAPEAAFELAVGGVVAHFEALDRSAAEAIVRVAALDAFVKARVDGHPDSYPIQQWRKQLLPGLS